MSTTHSTKHTSFKNPLYFSQLGNGRWYCNLCTKTSKNVYRRAFQSYQLALAHEFSTEHVKMEEQIYSWHPPDADQGWLLDDWAADHSIPDSDPTKEAQLKKRFLASMVDGVHSRVDQWIEDIVLVGGAYTRELEVEAPSRKVATDPSDTVLVARQRVANSPLENTRTNSDTTPSSVLPPIEEHKVELLLKPDDNGFKQVSQSPAKEWLARLSRRRGYRQLDMASAMRFFELTLDEKVQKIEAISRNVLL